MEPRNQLQEFDESHFTRRKPKKKFYTAEEKRFAVDQLNQGVPTKWIVNWIRPGCSRTNLHRWRTEDEAGRTRQAELDRQEVERQAAAAAAAVVAPVPAPMAAAANNWLNWLPLLLGQFLEILMFIVRLLIIAACQLYFLLLILIQIIQFLLRMLSQWG